MPGRPCWPPMQQRPTAPGWWKCGPNRPARSWSLTGCGSTSPALRSRHGPRSASPDVSAETTGNEEFRSRPGPGLQQKPSGGTSVAGRPRSDPRGRPAGRSPATHRPRNPLGPGLDHIATLALPGPPGQSTCASSSTGQSIGLLIRRFRVRVPGGVQTETPGQPRFSGDLGFLRSVYAPPIRALWVP